MDQTAGLINDEEVEWCHCCLIGLKSGVQEPIRRW